MSTTFKQNLLKTLAIFAVIGMLLIILAGAVVTKTGSGDGCGPNWPLCHDQLIPENPTLETMIEYTHRLVTLVVGTLVMVFSMWMAVKYRKIREVLWVAFASIFFLTLQSGLGALAVVFGQSALVMALHFGFSLLSFATVLLLMIYVFQLDRNEQLPVITVNPLFKTSTLFLFMYTYIVVYLGALVRHTDSSMGCNGWPLCNGQLIPNIWYDAIAVQFTHRLAAFIFLIAVIAFFVHVFKQHQHNRLLFVSAISLLVLALLQVFTGGYIVLTGLTLVPSLMHALFITLFYGILSYLVLYVYRE